MLWQRSFMDKLAAANIRVVRPRLFSHGDRLRRGVRKRQSALWNEKDVALLDGVQVEDGTA